MNSTTTQNGKKTALITGANAGIGKEIARQLAAAGEFSKVYLACRNKDKALAAKRDLEQVTGKTVFEIIIMDVSKPAAVRAAVFCLDHAIDVLIMNAGGVGGKTPFKLTPEGVTEQFAHNLLVHVVLLDELLKVNKLTSAAVYLGSEAARGVWQLGIKSPAFESYSAEEFSSVCDGKFFAGKKADSMPETKAVVVRSWSGVPQRLNGSPVEQPALLRKSGAASQFWTMNFFQPDSLSTVRLRAPNG